MISYDLKKLINNFLYNFNIKISRPNGKRRIYPVEASKRDIEIMEYILLPNSPRDVVNSKALSMVSIERLWAVIQSTKYIINNNIDGDFVECGVWRGGCSLAIAMVLEDLKAERKIYLFDTFEGMTEPTKYDNSIYGKNAEERYKNSKKAEYSTWCYASIKDVKSEFKKVGLEKKAIFVKGDVIETLNKELNLPDKISLLRLDTDWYESTKHELNVLYPKLVKDGVLLIDDYGSWEGARKAVDEYFLEYDLDNTCLMWKTDHTGRGLIKK